MMKSSKRKSSHNKIINFHKITNKLNDSFVGIKIKNNSIDFYYPETYDLDESSIDNYKNDVIDILRTITIAKTQANSNLKSESSAVNNDVMPLLSYLWIIKDYLINGMYLNREKVIKRNQKGKIDWKLTLNTEPIISNGNVIYNDIFVMKKNNLDNIMVQIHKYCVKKSIDIIGWLFKIPNSNFIKIMPFYESYKNIYIDAIKRELNNTFNDEKKMRLKHMLSIVAGLGNEKQENEFIYGVDSYTYIFEKMINSIFGNKDATKFNPSAKWYLKSNNYKPIQSSDLRPDTVLVYDNKAYILDSKFYRFGFTMDNKDLPETSSIQKQITYGDYIKTNKIGDEIKEVKSAFILPYNKYNNKFGFNNNLEYIGYSKTDYRKGLEKHEVIFAFLIDLKYVVQTWNKGNHNNDIIDLVKQIENI